MAPRGRAGGSRKTPVTSREEVFRELVAPLPPPHAAVRDECESRGVLPAARVVGLSEWLAKNSSAGEEGNAESGVRPENVLDPGQQGVMKQLGESCLVLVRQTSGKTELMRLCSEFTNTSMNSLTCFEFFPLVSSFLPEVQKKSPPSKIFPTPKTPPSPLLQRTAQRFPRPFVKISPTHTPCVQLCGRADELMRSR